MKETNFFKSLGITVGLFPLLTSCVSTETVDCPEPEVKIGDEIVLNLSAPESLTTRAGSDHKLRYIAIIYEGTEKGSGYNFLERKEILEGETEKNTVVFRVAPDNDYKIILFADYIPESYKRDETTGFYPDCYYDTNKENVEASKGIMTMRAFIDKDGETTLNQHCINNDNYDCFSFALENIHKEEEEVVRDPVLTRATAKVRFVSTTGEAEDFQSISFSNLDFYNEFNIFAGDASRNDKFKNSFLEEISFSTMSNPSENELFYFYTLGPNTIKSKNLKTIKFTLNTVSEDKPREITISDYQIPVLKNNITTVKGNFLPGVTVEDPENDGKGDIILHMSTNEKWDNELDEDWDKGLNYEIK